MVVGLAHGLTVRWVNGARSRDRAPLFLKVACLSGISAKSRKDHGLDLKSPHERLRSLHQLDRCGGSSYQRCSPLV